MGGEHSLKISDTELVTSSSPPAADIASNKVSNLWLLCYYIPRDYFLQQDSPLKEHQVPIVLVCKTCNTSSVVGFRFGPLGPGPDTDSKGEMERRV